MDHESLLTGLASIFILGIGAQWIAWRLGAPAIILLLLAGILAGPITSFLRPDELLGELLFPIVSLSVALVLFEGSLRLRFHELPEVGRPLLRLLTIGAAVTWGLSALAAYLILRIHPVAALLLGAILVVTGPTVIGPLLAHIRPEGRIGQVVKWEGIVIDPIGAVLAVLVFEVSSYLIGQRYEHAAALALFGLLRTILFGGGIGLLGAAFLVLVLWRRWVPDQLDSPLTMMVVVACFTASNLMQHEAGLLAVTVLGIALANQSWVDLRHIAEFKENIGVVLISSLFILLTARIPAEELTQFGWRGMLFVAVLILLVRPLAVLLSTFGTSLDWRERAFLAWLAPRGIVAASVASVFALRLEEAGDGLAGATFLVIAGTVAVYGATAGPLARLLGLASDQAEGLLIVSAHPGARAIAHAVREAGFRVLLVDSNYHNIQAARLEGLETEYADILSRRATEGLNLGGIGRMLAITPNDEVNSLAALHFAEVFGRSQVYELPPAMNDSERHQRAEQHFRGRFLFGPRATYQYLDRRFASGAIVKATRLTPEFNFEQFREQYGDDALVLFIIDASGKRLSVCTADLPCKPQVGETVLALVDPPEKQPDWASTGEARSGSARPKPTTSAR